MMKIKSRQSGLSLIEMTAVVGAVALLAFLAVPAARKFLDSFGSTGSAASMIQAALASARTIAAKEHRYAGIRFQFDKKGPLQGDQYMIFIIHDPEETGHASGFRAVKGVKPVKLPTTVGVMDLRHSGSEVIDTPNEIQDQTDTSTFSIVFSPSGKLVLHDVRTKWLSLDMEQKFADDRDGTLGPVQEPSRNRFIIYEKRKFKNALKQGDDVLLQYLTSLKPMFINAYTGTIISRD